MQTIMRTLANICVALCCCSLSVARATTNLVTRTISAVNGSVVVEDHIRLKADTYPALADLEKIASKGGTNFVPALKTLLTGEDLLIQSAAVKISDGSTDVRFSSRVSFPAEFPAKVKLVPFWPTGISDAIELKLFAIEGNKFLFLPDIFSERRNNFSAKVIAFGLLNFDEAVDRFLPMRSDLQLQCIVKTPSGQETILDYSPERPTPNGPSSAVIDALDKTHKLSGNEIQALFTKVKIGKSGYYALDTAGFLARCYSDLKAAVQAFEGIDRSKIRILCVGKIKRRDISHPAYAAGGDVGSLSDGRIKPEE